MQPQKAMVVTGSRHGEWAECKERKLYARLPDTFDLMSPVMDEASITYEAYECAETYIKSGVGEVSRVRFWLPESWGSPRQDAFLRRFGRVVHEVNLYVNWNLPDIGFSIAHVCATISVCEDPENICLEDCLGIKREVTYSEDMPGMTLEEFQSGSDEIIRESQDT